MNTLPKYFSIHCKNPILRPVVKDQASNLGFKWDINYQETNEEFFLFGNGGFYDHNVTGEYDLISLETFFAAQPAPQTLEIPFGQYKIKAEKSGKITCGCVTIKGTRQK